MKIRTCKATPQQLNWLVAKIEDLTIDNMMGGAVWAWSKDALTDEDEAIVIFMPSNNWSQGGPIIERERIQVFPHNGATEWCGVAHVQRDGYIAILTQDGPTPLIAAMRCYAASKLGDEVDVPDELLGG